MQMITKSKFKLSEGQSLISEFEESGLKPGAFCSQKKIPYHLLKYWRDRCRDLNSGDASGAKFLPVKILEQTPQLLPIKIVLGRICIEIPCGTDLLQLKNVLQVCIACG
jgi:hypothetical protein